MSLRNILSKRNRVLLRELVITDFKLRYQGSALGYLWSLLKPLFMFAILYTVFGLVLRIGADIEHFPVYLLLGIVLWGFFSEATNNGLQAIVERGDLIRKINFPKYIIIIAGTLSSLINLGFNLAVVFFFMWINGVEFGWGALYFPLIIIELYVFALALAFLLSALFVKFRDINYLWEVGMQAAFYATPILYPVSMVVEKSDVIAKIILLSPMAQMIQDARHYLITPQSIRLNDLTANPWMIAVPFIIVGVTVIVASMYFKKSSKYFAEKV